MMNELLMRIQHYWTSFWRISIFMRISWNARNTLDSKVELWQLITSSSHENDKKPTETAIDMHRNVSCMCNRCNLINIIHSSVWIVWNWADELKLIVKTCYHWIIKHFKSHCKLTMIVFESIALFKALTSALYVFGSNFVRRTRMPK